LRHKAGCFIDSFFYYISRCTSVISPMVNKILLLTSSLLST